MKKRAVVIRAVCYLLMLAAVLAWPVWKIIQADFYKVQSRKFLLPVQSTVKNGLEDYFEFKSGFIKESNALSGKQGKMFFISIGCMSPVWYTLDAPVSKP